MVDPRSKETQQELFEEFSSASKKKEPFAGISRSQKPLLISTNVEQILMAGILFILALCGVFFLGVLRGKSLSPPAPLPARAVVPPPGQGAVPAPPVATTPPVMQNAVPQAGPYEKPYTIQLVTHRKRELAEAEMNAVRSAGFYSSIIPSGEYFQVCAGQYASKEEAKKDLARFMTKYKDCFLRRR